MDQNPRRVVVKVGSSTLTTSESSIDLEYIDNLADQLCRLAKEGWQVVLVSSAAIACGLGKLGIMTRPTDMPSLQAAASVGQSELVGAYADAFGKHGVVTSLVLLTRRDTADRNAYLHARDTLGRLLELGVIPVVNENDTVSVEQIRFGDNDSLAALVACLIDASLLVIASDIDGLFTGNPRTDPYAELIREVDKVDAGIISASEGAGSVAGSGGMLTKVRAARVMMAAGIPMAVVNGKAEDAIYNAANGSCVGTLFSAKGRRHEITSRKLWIALADSSKGSITVDEGASNALVNGGKSLLCVGICGIDGSFEEGDVVDIKNQEELVIARGITKASSDVIALGMGRTSDELAANKLLAPLSDTPIVHRDDLIVFE